MIAAELQEHVHVMIVLEEALELTDVHMLQRSVNLDLHLKLIVEDRK